MSLISYIAIAYGVACVGVIGFQLALIAGAPWGPLTQGGKHKGALPPAGRIAAFVSIFVIAAMACGVMSAAGLWPQWPNWTKWVALTVQSLVAVLNWITPSKPERALWGPLESVMLVLAALVVFSA